MGRKLIGVKKKVRNNIEIKEKKIRYTVNIVLFVIDILITSFATQFIWNSIVAELFGIRTITVMQGWALSMAITYFQTRNRNEVDNYTKYIFEDIIYTVLTFAISFVIVMIAF